MTWAQVPLETSQVLEEGATPVSPPVSPAERRRADIDALFDGGTDLAAAIGQVARLGTRLLLRSALEAEVTAFPGRDRYERAASSETARGGMRNGYCPVTVKTTLQRRSCAARQRSSPRPCSAPG
jgi:hypothetical protein